MSPRTTTSKAGIGTSTSKRRASAAHENAPSRAGKRAPQASASAPLAIGGGGSAETMDKAVAEAAELANSGHLPAMPSAAERESMIAEAAYARYAARGFARGDPQEDWLQAEREVNERLAGDGR